MYHLPVEVNHDKPESVSTSTISYMHEPAMQLPLVQSESKEQPFIFREQDEARHSSPKLQSESKSHAPVLLEHELPTHCSSLAQSESNLQPFSLEKGEHVPSSQFPLTQSESKVQLSVETGVEPGGVFGRGITVRQAVNAKASTTKITI